MEPRSFEAGASASAPTAPASPSLGYASDGNPLLGSPATVPGAFWFHKLGEELRAILTATGITPSDADLAQVAKGIQTGSLWTAAASGTADAITASFSPPIAVLTNGMSLSIRATLANATTTPTFTPNSGTIAAAAIVKGNNLPLAAGDIAGAGHWIELQYDATLGKWVLLNAATGITTASAPVISSKIQPLATPTVAVGALTVGLNPTTLDFRSSTLSAGGANTVSIVSALSLIVPSGATLGCLSSSATYTKDRLVLVALYNGGTPVLGIINIAGGVNLDETTLISSTTISSSATANNVCYTTAAVSNSPFRVVGYIDLPAQTTAGTWVTAPNTVQGVGGQALAVLGSLGYGQNWSDYTSSRVFGTTYYNTTGKPIKIRVSATGTGAGMYNLQITTNGYVLPYSGEYANSSGYVACESEIIPPGSSYSLAGGAANLTAWSELR